MAPSTAPATSTRPSSALRTDRYELTMLEAAVLEGIADRPAVFECFARKLPAGRRYGVFAGLGRFLDELEVLRFGEAELRWLEEAQVVGPETLEWLSRFSFSGDIDAYREGEVYLPHSPLVTVSSSFGEGLLLETLLLSIVNADSAIAGAGARMVRAAAGAELVEMGGRRTNEQAATAAARAAALVGFTASSNLEAGRRYGVVTRGTAAHAWTLAHADEVAAFRAQVRAQGVGTTLLVDTFDVAQGVRNALEAAGGELGAIRIDSGDLAENARLARSILDEAGATRTRIVVTGDLDEYSIEALVAQRAPIDAFGVGTSLVTGSGRPTIGAVYKLVQIQGDNGVPRPVTKRSRGKGSVGGRKRAHRLYEHDRSGTARAEHLVTDLPSYVEYVRGTTHTARALQERVVEHGEIIQRRSLEEAAAFHAQVLTELPEEAHLLADGTACIPTIGQAAPAAELPSPAAAADDGVSGLRGAATSAQTRQLRTVEV